MLRLLEKYPNGLAGFYKDQNQQAKEENRDLSVLVKTQDGGDSVKVESTRID